MFCGLPFKNTLHPLKKDERRKVSDSITVQIQCSNATKKLLLELTALFEKFENKKDKMKQFFRRIGCSLFTGSNEEEYSFVYNDEIRET